MRVAIGVLQSMHGGTLAIRTNVANVGALPQLVQMLRYRSERVSDAAVTELRNTGVSEQCQVAIVDAGAIPQLIRLLCSP